MNLAPGSNHAVISTDVNNILSSSMYLPARTSTSLIYRIQEPGRDKKLSILRQPCLLTGNQQAQNSTKRNVVQKLKTSSIGGTDLVGGLQQLQIANPLRMSYQEKQTQNLANNLNSPQPRSSNQYSLKTSNNQNLFLNTAVSRETIPAKN